MDLFPEHKSKLIKDTTREEREEIVRRALRCSEGCENCTGCALGAGDAFEMYRPYIEGKLEIPCIERRRSMNQLRYRWATLGVGVIGHQLAEAVSLARTHGVVLA